jgi:hypothetical protein
LKERDIMNRYTDEYESDTKHLSLMLIWTIVVLLGLALILFYFSSRTLPMIPVVLFIAGAAGSCVSVLSLMPTSEVASSQASVSLRRRILSRVATGMMASITGCALLAWGILPIVVQKTSFADVLEACHSASDHSCSSPYGLIILAIPMIFGFAEWILARMVERFLGRASAPGNPVP